MGLRTRLPLYQRRLTSRSDAGRLQLRRALWLPRVQQVDKVIGGASLSEAGFSDGSATAGSRAKQGSQWYLRISLKNRKSASAKCFVRLGKVRVAVSGARQLLYRSVLENVRFAFCGWLVLSCSKKKHLVYYEIVSIDNIFSRMLSTFFT